MIKLLTRADLIVSSFFINLLGLALPIYVIQSFTRYLSNGFDETLYALTLGVLAALLFEFFFKNYSEFNNYDFKDRLMLDFDINSDDIHNSFDSFSHYINQTTLSRCIPIVTDHPAVNELVNTDYAFVVSGKSIKNKTYLISTLIVF